MSLPDGVTTCLVTYGPITDTFGNPADSITVEVVADRTIVHAASGRTLFKNPVSVTADSGGIAQIPVPHTNQSGFRDQQQNALTGWYYIVRLTARFGTAIQTDSKTFQPLVGQTTIDADLLSSSGMVTPGVTTPTSVVTSVAGYTGDVTAGTLAVALSPDTGVRSKDFSSGQLAFQRLGNDVDLSFIGADLSALMDGPLAGFVPVGWRPSVSKFFVGFWDDNVFVFEVTPAGDIALQSTPGSAPENISGALSYFTSNTYPEQPFAGSPFPS